MTWLRLEPIDAWFFRDGRPYTQGEADQSNVTSLFPPSPFTISGALRAAIARSNGWNGRYRGWDSGHLAALGDGPEETGQVSFHGPFLTVGGELLFAAPLNLLSRENGDLTLIGPGEPVECDLGTSVRLPTVSRKNSQHADWRPVHPKFLTTAGLIQVLRGQLPANSDVVPTNKLWQLEPRIALQRDSSKHTTGDEGDIYSPEYARVRRDVSLAVEVRGMPANWQWPKLLTLGGEGRMAGLEQMLPPPVLPTPEIVVANSIEGTEIAVFCLTPLRLPLRDGAAIEVLPGRDLLQTLGIEGVELISACAERPVMLGGWNSQAPGPLPLRPCLGAGTVLFCKANNGARNRLQGFTANGLGRDARLGFNQFALGVSPVHAMPVNRSNA
jgi:CRISPR-associated protein Cmr3